jgi:hypothetical protein
MGRFNKKHILIILIIGIFLLTGCNKFRFGTFNASEDKTKTEVTLAPEATQEEAVKNNKQTEPSTVEGEDANASITAASTTPTTSPVQPKANAELPVYTVNAETEAVETVTALVPADSEITPQLIVDTVIESLADQSIIIAYDNVSTSGDSVIVSFIKDKAPYSNMGSGYEAAILDSIAYSLLENLDDYHKVIYQIEGKSYSSGVFDYGIDEPYMED